MRGKIHIMSFSLRLPIAGRVSRDSKDSGLRNSCLCVEKILRPDPYSYGSLVLSRM